MAHQKQRRHSVRPMTSAGKTKHELRRHAQRARRAMTPHEREDASLMIFDHVVRTPQFRRARYLATSLPLESEVNTWPLIERAKRMKKRVFAPKIKKNGSLRFCELDSITELTSNRFGIAEPQHDRSIDVRRLDVVIVPLVAFDECCNRIGMGGGFYDRTFSFLSHRRSFKKPKLIGLAFNCQRVEHIPASPWDIQLFRVITESGNEAG